MNNNICRGSHITLGWFSGRSSILVASYTDVLRLVTRSSWGGTRDKPKNVCVGGYYTNSFINNECSVIITHERNLPFAGTVMCSSFFACSSFLALPSVSDISSDSWLELLDVDGLEDPKRLAIHPVLLEEADGLPSVTVWFSAHAPLTDINWKNNTHG